MCDVNSMLTNMLTRIHTVDGGGEQGDIYIIDLTILHMYISFSKFKTC